MVLELANSFYKVFGFCWSAWAKILDAVDGYGAWFSAFCVWLAYKFILAPLFGYAGSDIAASAHNAVKNSYRNSGNGKFSSGNRNTKYGSGKNGGRFERK